MEPNYGRWGVKTMMRDTRPVPIFSSLCLPRQGELFVPAEILLGLFRSIAGSNVLQSVRDVAQLHGRQVVHGNGVEAFTQAVDRLPRGLQEEDVKICPGKAWNLVAKYNTSKKIGSPV